MTKIIFSALLVLSSTFSHALTEAFAHEAIEIKCVFATHAMLSKGEPYAVYRVLGEIAEGVPVSVAHGISPVDSQDLTVLTTARGRDGSIHSVWIDGQRQEGIEIFQSKIVNVQTENFFEIERSVAGSEFGTDFIDLVNQSGSMIWGAYDSCRRAD